MQFWTKNSVQRWKGQPNMRNSFPIVLVWRHEIKPIEQNKITPRLPGRVDRFNRVDRLANLSSVRFCRSLYLSFAWDDMATATWKHFPQGAWYCIGIQGSTSAPNMMKYIMISMINHDTTGILTHLISRCNGIALRPENRFCQASNGFKGCFGQV